MTVDIITRISNNNIKDNDVPRKKTFEDSLINNNIDNHDVIKRSKDDVKQAYSTLTDPSKDIDGIQKKEDSEDVEELIPKGWEDKDYDNLSDDEGDDDCIYSEMLEKGDGRKEKLLSYVNETFDVSIIPKDIEKWSWTDIQIWIIKRKDEKMPADLTDIRIGSLYPGNHHKEFTEKPDWFDEEKFRRGQKFAREYSFGLSFSNMLSLFLIFSFDEGLKPLILSKRSHTPYLAFKRYLSTGRRLRNWYTEDPWNKETGAHKDIRVVQRMHLAMRRELCRSSYDEIHERGTIKTPGCPMMSLLRKDFDDYYPHGDSGSAVVHTGLPIIPKNLNQGDMAVTQFAFVGFFITYQEHFGVHNATKQDIDDFCHLWRVIGYLLGIEDRWNFCRGTVEEVLQRSRDIIQYWMKPNFREITPEWEHMSSSMVEGISYYVPGASFPLSLIYLTDMLEIPMPRLYSSLSFSQKCKHRFHKLLFFVLARFKIIRHYFNNVTNKTLDKALAFDAEKHAQLKEKSSKSIFNYSMS